MRQGEPTGRWGETTQARRNNTLGTRTRGHYERGLSPRESLKSLKSLEFPENGRNLLSFAQSEGSLEALESLNSLQNSDFSEKTLFPKDSFSRTRGLLTLARGKAAIHLLEHHDPITGLISYVLHGKAGGYRTRKRVAGGTGRERARKSEGEREREREREKKKRKREGKTER